MRQSYRDRRQHLHRGLSVPRLTTMFLMLAIMGLIFVQLRNPNNWRLFGSREDESQVVSERVGARSTGFSWKADEPPLAGGTASAMPPEGGTTNVGTDLDPREMEKIKPFLDVFYDGSLESMPAEQPAYFQVLSWVDHQSTDTLRKRANRAFFYDTLVKAPDSMRLQIVETKLSVRQIVPVMGRPKDGRPQPLLSHDGKEIYEVRGVTLESGSNLYFGMVTDLPPGTPIGTLINENALLVGYFFRVQGYYSKQQQLDFEASQTRRMVPLKAPLIIGRLAWITPPATVADKTPVWVLASVGGIAIVLVLAWVYWCSRQRPHAAVPRITETTLIDPDALPVDRWLDQAQSGKISDEGLPDTVYFDGAMQESQGQREGYLGNIFGEKRDSSSGDQSGNRDSRS